MTLLIKITIASICAYYLWQWFIRCRLFGHTYKNDHVFGPLVRSCKCCNKTQVLKIGVGYVD